MLCGPWQGMREGAGPYAQIHPRRRSARLRASRSFSNGGSKRPGSGRCEMLRRTVQGGFLSQESAGLTPPRRRWHPKASPPASRPQAPAPQGQHHPGPAAGLPSNAPARPPEPAEEGPREPVLPLFSSVLPRAGCTGAAGGGGKGSTRWAGATAAAPPACGVKERPWPPSPRGVSSTRGNRARPAPTGARHRPRQPPGASRRCLPGACGSARDPSSGRVRGGGS